MNKPAMILLTVILPACALPAQAQIFSRRPAANPAQRVPELIVIVKSDADERKRSSAAEELGRYDGKTFSEIAPVLIDVLQNDAKSGVRAEAASSLAHLRPISQAAGQALDRAAASDDNWRVRWQAKTSLVKYRLAGYSNTMTDVKKPAGTTAEPPLYQTEIPPVKGKDAPPPAQFPTSNKKDPPRPTPEIPRPLPQGPKFSTAVPQTPQRVTPQPVTNPTVEQGPSLPLPSAPPPEVKSPF